MKAAPAPAISAMIILAPPSPDEVLRFRCLGLEEVVVDVGIVDGKLNSPLLPLVPRSSSSDMV